MSEELENLALTLSARQIADRYTTEQMMIELEEYAENAGFANYYEKVLRYLSPQQIVSDFMDMICDYQDMIKHVDSQYDSYY